MYQRPSYLLRSGILFLCGLFLCSSQSYTQEDEVEPGHSIGKVSTNGDLIVIELDKGALGKANQFDLVGRTLRFTPERSGYRVESGPLHWDSDFGPETDSAEIPLHQFGFPFSGEQWHSFFIGRTGSISFGKRDKDPDSERGDRNEGGVSIGRFEPLADAAGTLIDSAPAICVFFKPRMSGPHYVKELADRVVITWDLTEPFGNIQDFTWFKTINRFQALLYRNGSIEMSYKELDARDAIVGVYPALSGTEKPLAAISTEPHPEVAAHLDLRNLKLSIVDGAVLKVMFETRGPVVPEGDRGVDGIAYRVFFDAHQALPNATDAPRSALVWTVRGIALHRRATTKYVAFGPGVLRKVKATGNTITIEGILPQKVRRSGSGCRLR